MAVPQLPAAVGLPCPYSPDSPEEAEALYAQLNGNDSTHDGGEGDEQALLQASQGNTSLTLVTSVVRAAQTLEQFAVGTQPFPVISLDGFAFAGLQDDNWVGKASKQLAAYFNMQGAGQFKQAFGYNSTSWSGRFELAVLEPANPDGDWLVVAAPTVRNVALLVNGIIHAAHPRKSDNSGAFTAFGNVLLFARRYSRNDGRRIDLVGLPNPSDAMHRLWHLPAMQRSLRALEKTHSAANLINQFGWLRNLSMAACDEDGTQVGSMAGLTQILTPDGRRVSYSGQFDAAYMSHLYKTRLCTCPEQAHDRDACHFGHVRTNGKGLVDIMDVRRPIGNYSYSGTWCPEVITTAAYGGKFKSASYRTCSRGASCAHCHSCIEFFYHPHNYRTSRCKGCSRPHLCAFWHNELERRSGGRSPIATPKVVTPDLVTPTMRSPVAMSAASGASSRATSPSGLGMDMLTASQMPFGSPTSYCHTPRSGSASSEDLHHLPPTSAAMAVLTSRMQELLIASAMAGQNPQHALAANQAAFMAAAARVQAQAAAQAQAQHTQHMQHMPGVAASQPLMQLAPCASNDDSWLPDEALKLYLGPTLTEVLETSGRLSVPASTLMQGAVAPGVMLSPQAQMQLAAAQQPSMGAATSVAELLARTQRSFSSPQRSAWPQAAMSQPMMPDVSQLAMPYGAPLDTGSVSIVVNLALMSGGKVAPPKLELHGLRPDTPASRVLDVLHSDTRYAQLFATADTTNTLLLMTQVPGAGQQGIQMVPVARLRLGSWQATVGALLAMSGGGVQGVPGYGSVLELYVHLGGAGMPKTVIEAATAEGSDDRRVLRQLTAVHFRFLEEVCRSATLPDHSWLRSRAAQLRWLRTWLEAAFELAAESGSVWWIEDGRQPGKIVLCFNTGLPSKNVPGQTLYAFMHSSNGGAPQPFMLRRGFISVAGSSEEAAQVMRTLLATSHFPPELLPPPPAPPLELEQLVTQTGNWQPMADTTASGTDLERQELELVMADPVLAAAIVRFTEDLIAIGINHLSSGSLHRRAVTAELDGHPEVLAMEALAWLTELHATCTFAHPVSEAARQLQALLEQLLEDVDQARALPLLTTTTPLEQQQQPTDELQPPADVEAAPHRRLHMLQWLRVPAATTLRSTGITGWAPAAGPMQLHVNFSGRAAAAPETLLLEFAGENVRAMLGSVASLAAPEWWGPDVADPWVLRELLATRFAFALEQGSLAVMRAPSKQDVLVFNTGLATEQLDGVYVLFKRNVSPDGGRRSPWLVCEVARGQDVVAACMAAPPAAEFASVAVDTSVVLDAGEESLLQDLRTRSALRAALPGLDEAFWGTLLAGGIQHAWRDAGQGLTEALPAFHRNYCHLLPLALDGGRAATPAARSPPKLVLVVVRDAERGGYRIESLLPLGIAYAAARIVKPVQNNWLAEAVNDIILGQHA